MQIKSIGIDLGKTTFHLVALNSRSQVVFSATTIDLHGQSALVVDWDGGLCGVAFSGACAARTRARGAPNSGAVCSTLREVEQERLLRRGGHCRSGGAREHAIRAHQDGRSARSASSAPSTRAVSVATNQRDQSDPSVSVGARHQFSKRASQPASADARDSGECG